MATKGLVLGSTAALATAVAVIGFQLASPSVAAFRENPKEIVDEVWQTINRDFVDGTFNGNDWRQVRRNFVENREYASRADAYRAIREMLQLLDDPYTRFLDPEQFRSMQIETSGQLTGVGLQLGMDDRTQELVVIAPIEDSPAAAAGLRARDVLVSINGRSTRDMDLNAAVSLIRGPVNTRVQLQVRRGTQVLDFDIQRARIELHAVRTHIRETPAGRVGYISLRQFNANASREMRRAIQTLNPQVSSFVLDLRANPGGLLYASAEIARMFMDNVTIVSTIDRQGENERLVANRQSLTDKPLVVLVDGSSASASEILAGALQDNRRAVVIGAPTFGKGLVQQVQSLSDGSGLAVTIAKYVTPRGRNINKAGIKPDIVVELSPADSERLTQNRDLIGTMADPQFARAVEVLVARNTNPRTPSATLP